MHAGNLPRAPRRSSRVPTALPILVTSLAGTYFSEVCKTLVVNAHGCAILSPVKFDAGVPLRFHHKDGRETTAHVVSCQPMGTENQGWRLAAKLDRPQNFWGLVECPDDWALPTPPPMSSLAPLTTLPPVASLPPVVSQTNASSSAPTARVLQDREATLDLVARRLETPMRRMIEEALAPVQSELATVKQTLARREANPSRFEVSLSSIPPELEQQLETRLKKDLGPKVLEDARSQYNQTLDNAKSAIEQRTKQGYEDFARRATEELKIVEKRAQDISVQMSANVQQQLRRDLDEFQQKLLEGGNSLKRLSEELLEYLHQNLHNEYNACRGDLEGLRASVSADSSQMHKEVETLNGRIAELDESAQSLESGLDKRLGQMASNTTKDVRGQLESMTSTFLEDLTARSMTLVEEQLAKASDKMKHTQVEVIASVSGSVEAQKTQALEKFEKSMEDVARVSVERWRLKLSTALKALASSVGEQFSQES